MPVPIVIILSADEETILQKSLRSGKAPVQLPERSKIVLLAAAESPNYKTAERMGTDVNKIGRWRKRYSREGCWDIEKDRSRGANHDGKDELAQATLPSLIIKKKTNEKAERATHSSTLRFGPIVREQLSINHSIYGQQSSKID